MIQKLTLKVYPEGWGRTAYRVIEVGDQMTLEKLCSTILDAFDFDHDHLYAFHMDNNVNSRMSEYSFNGWGARESRVNVKLSKFGLVKGQKFVLHYDFGDDWLFRIGVQKVEEAEKVNTKIIKSVGEVDQYPEYDEDGEW
ncbi:MAG: hypothetical protein IJT77_07960 [Clostridia bacterium]|nr:hypothetical protein [Clostridia bacterium]